MKNKLKKVFAAGLGLAMIFSQCGCKAGTPGQTSASNAPDAVQTDIPDLCKTVASKDGLGEDAIVGTCYGDDEISDAKLMQIVTKHFNAVTLENELKPETMFGNSNAAPASDSIHKEELNGEQIDVPIRSHLGTARTPITRSGSEATFSYGIPRHPSGSSMKVTTRARITSPKKR